jgi:geranylgeranyl diphosphate synthase type I
VVFVVVAAVLSGFAEAIVLVTIARLAFALATDRSGVGLSLGPLGTVTVAMETLLAVAAGLVVIDVGVGDLAFVYADQLLGDAPREAWRIWNELRIELNIGQYLDILGSVQRVRDLGKAERICRYKSGKYTIERPLHLGAVLAAPERADELLPALSAYGLPLGDAFQMRDDVMGAFGDTALTGKPVGGDLIEGKPTPLLARAVANASVAQLGILDLVGRPGMTDDDVADIQQVIVETGALAALEEQIAHLTADAVGAIDRAPITTPAKAELVALAEYVSSRAT